METTIISNELYTAIRKAKVGVQSMLDRYPRMTSDNMYDIFDKIKSEFTAEERAIVACGYFVEYPDTGSVVFNMPSTSTAINFFKKGIDNFKNGGFKAILRMETSESIYGYQVSNYSKITYTPSKDQ